MVLHGLGPLSESSISSSITTQLHRRPANLSGAEVYDDKDDDPTQHMREFVIIALAASLGGFTYMDLDYILSRLA